MYRYRSINTHLFFFLQEQGVFSLEMANARPMNLILTSSEPKVITGLQNSSDGVNIYVSEASLFLSVSIQSVGCEWVHTMRISLHVFPLTSTPNSVF